MTDRVRLRNRQRTDGSEGLERGSRGREKHIEAEI